MDLLRNVGTPSTSTAYEAPESPCSSRQVFPHDEVPRPPTHLPPLLSPRGPPQGGQELLGHFLNLQPSYLQHVLPGMQEKAVAAMDEIFSAGRR